MAQISETDQEHESQFMTLFWRLIKETYVPEQDPGYWDDLVERIGQINGVCESNMDWRLLTAYTDYLESEWKRMKQEAQDGKDET